MPPAQAESLSLHATLVNGPPQEEEVNTPRTVSVAVVPGAEAWQELIVYAALTDGVKAYHAEWDAVAQKVGLNTTYHTSPGAHYWFIWRYFLGDYGSMLFR